MKKFLMIVVLSVCLSGCISIANAPVTTPPAPAVSTPIRTSDVQTPVQTPTVVSTPTVTTPCTTCGGYYQYPQYQYPQYQYPCTTCQQQTPTVIYQPSTPTVIYQYPVKPTTILPEGWEWHWDGSQWISRRIPGYVIPTPVIPIPVVTVPTIVENVAITALGDPSPSQWRAQTFAGSVVTLTKISVMMERLNNPGDVVCDLMLSNVKGHPYGAVLASCRASASSITSKSSYSFPLSYSLSSAEYAVVFHTISGDRNNRYIFYGTNFNSYESGCVELSSDGGGIWRSYYKLDMAFSIN